MSELSDLERDVLLASSGELPAWRRWRLRRRLARDPDAARLAETLALVSLLQPRAARGSPAQAAGASRVRHWWAWAGSAAAAAAALVLALTTWLAPPRAPTDALIASSPAAPPLHESSRRVLLASLGMDLAPPASPWPDVSHGVASDAPPLPAWSGGVLADRDWVSTIYRRP